MKISRPWLILSYLFVASVAALGALYLSPEPTSTVLERGAIETKAAAIDLEGIEKRLSSIEEKLAELLAREIASASSQMSGSSASATVPSAPPLSAAEKRRRIELISSKLQLEVDRYENLLDERLRDFDQAKLRYDEGKINLTQLQAIKRELEEIEFNLEQSKLVADQQISELQR